MKGLWRVRGGEGFGKVWSGGARAAREGTHKGLPLRVVRVSGTEVRPAEGTSPTVSKSLKTNLGLAVLIGLCVGLSGSLPKVLRASAASSVQVFVQPGAQVAPIVSLIRQAHSSLRLEVYLLTDRTTVRELGRAKQRGVDVRVLLEEHPYGGSRSAQRAYGELNDAGVPVRWANERSFTYTHAKAMEADGRVAGIFTSNLTFSGISRNREFGIVEQSSADARGLAAIFDADWNRRPLQVHDPRLVISPYNSRRAFDSLIDGARHTLDVYAEEVADGSIEAHLGMAARRGVRVRLITSASSAGVRTIQQRGVSVRLMPHPYVHAKAMVADGTRLFVGSENMSSTSLDLNREVGILLDDRNTSAVVERTFAGDWGSIGPSGPPPRTTKGLRVRVTTNPRSVRRGQLLTIGATTSPGAQCSIRVTYPDGYVSRARSLSSVETADASGRVSWSWHVGTKVPGTSRASVTCTLGSASATGGATFEVR